VNTMDTLAELVAQVVENTPATEEQVWTYLAGQCATRAAIAAEVQP